MSYPLEYFTKWHFYHRSHQIKRHDDDPCVVSRLHALHHFLQSVKEDSGEEERVGSAATQTILIPRH